MGSVKTATAYVFPGQGSQYTGMARQLDWCGQPARSVLGEAEDVTGLPLRELMTTADGTTLANPEVAQLAVFVHSMVQLREMVAEGREPFAVAGHSLGEYTALVACGSLDWTDALHLVAMRGRAMAEAAEAEPGAMAAIVGLESSTVRELCTGAGGTRAPVVIANVNSPRQYVVSGGEAAVRAVVEAARRAGAIRAKQLPVGGAYHSPLMASAQQKLAPRLRAATLREPRIDFVSSVTGATVRDIEDYREALIGQITAPVLWRYVVETLAMTEMRYCVEVGPGRVLSGLGREMARHTKHLTAWQLLSSKPSG